MKSFTTLLATASLAALACAAPTPEPRSCSLPSSYSWTSTDALAQPQNNWTALKDFTHVPYNGGHLVYGTLVAYASENKLDSMGFSVFDSWDQMSSAKQTLMNGFKAVAPTLFYFEPKSTWVLAHAGANGPFSYRTTSDPTDANGWSEAQTLFSGKITNTSTGPIDQTVIADSENIYLFFAGDNGKVYRSSMPLGDFPGSFGNSSELILSDATANLFEAVQVYSVQGTSTYLMIVECYDTTGYRFFRSFTATSLGGTFTEQSGLSSNPFAGKSNVGATWSNDFSHGDIIRATADQTMPIDPCNLQLLYQGKQAGVSSANYTSQPWRPALLTHS